MQCTCPTPIVMLNVLCPGLMYLGGGCSVEVSLLPNPAWLPLAGNQLLGVSVLLLGSCIDNDSSTHIAAPLSGADITAADVREWLLS